MAFLVNGARLKAAARRETTRRRAEIATLILARYRAQARADAAEFARLQEVVANRITALTSGNKLAKIGA